MNIRRHAHFAHTVGITVVWGIGCLTSLLGGTPSLTAQSNIDDGFEFSSNEWPWWRGPDRNGTAHADQSPPLKWGESENVRWRTAIPGRGYGSPTVVGHRIFLATADEESGAQMMLCLDRKTGQERWRTTVHPSGGMRDNNKSTAASSTPACDGQRVFINFPNDGRLVTSALSVDGDILWQQSISNYVVHQGYGASPALYQELVIVTADNKGGGAIAALNRETGDVVWRRERPREPNYASPILVHTNGRDQVILVGCDQIVSFDPLTGETNWETEGATTECVTSTLTDGELVYTSGGYPRNHMSAIRADGSTELAWENDSRLYVPSLVIRDGYLYGVLDAGIAMCWKADTGEVQWRARLGGTFSSSCVLVDDQVFATSEAGETFIFRATPEGYEELAKNSLGTEVLATPTIVGGVIYHRVAHRDGPDHRQEYLYAIGQDTDP